MKLKYEFAVSQVCGAWCAVAVGASVSKYSGVISLNETAADMMKLLKDDITEDQLILQMQQMYDVPKEVLRRDVHDFVLRLRKANVL